MDGRDESDQRGRICHRGDEERQDRSEGGETYGNAKKAAIDESNGDVVTQMPAGELFNFGEGKHCLILIEHWHFTPVKYKARLLHWAS